MLGNAVSLNLERKKLRAVIFSRVAGLIIWLLILLDSDKLGFI